MIATWNTGDRTRWVAPAVAGGLALLALGLGLRGVDWPAQLYRVQLFRHHGWLSFDTSWYGGHYPLAYSLLFPPLAATLSVPVVALASAVAAAWGFDRLVWREFGRPGRIGSLLFAAGTVVQVAIGQLPFLLGLTFAILAVLAARCGRWRWAAVAAIASALASPVAAVFLTLVAAAWAVTTAPSQRGRPALLALAALLPGLVMSGLYRQLGAFPFPVSGLICVLLACAAAQLLFPAGHRGLRVGAALYAAGAIVAFLVPTPVGGNVSRLGATLAVPLLAAAARPGRRLLAAAVAIPLLAWQWTPAVGAATTGHDRSAHQAYYVPLIAEVKALSPGPTRLEIPFTRDHWEVAMVAPQIPLARGWYRQLDILDDPLFYQPNGVTAASYQSWLYGNGTTYVALPDQPLDYSSTGEAALLRTPPAYLQPVWHNRDWQLWRVAGSPGLASGSGQLVSLEPGQFALTASEKGDAVVRVRYTPTWSVVSGLACLAATPDGWTLVRVQSRGTIRVQAGLLPAGTGAC
jgi:hypothetical protein